MTISAPPMSDLEKTLAALRLRPWRGVLLERRQKRPPLGGPWTVTTDAGLIAQHVDGGGNLGLLTHEQTGVAVLDPDKILEWADMINTLGQPAEAWVETGSGRLHYYVEWQPDLPAKLLWAGQIIGEIQRGPGQQQVVIPPSLHPELGRSYRWLVDPATEPLRPLPDEWRAYFRSLAFAEPGRSWPMEYADAALRQPGAKRRNLMVKFQCPACRSEGHDRHQDNAAYFLNSRTWGCAWAKDTDLGRAHWDAIGIALGAFGSASDTDTPIHHIVPLGVGLGHFLAQEFPSPEPFVEGILSDEGGGWIGGEEKLLKTIYSLDEALCLSHGLPVCGRYAVPTRRRVLFIEEEDPPRRTHRRLKALLRGHGLDPDDPQVRADLDQWMHISVWEGFTFDVPAMVARLEAAIRAFHPEVCYIDVLRKVTLKDLNKAVEVGPLLAILDDLRRKYAVIFRVVHHYRKTQGFRVGRGSQEIGGSYLLGAWGENSLFFEPIGRKQGPVRVEIQSKDAPPQPAFTLRVEAEGPLWAPHLLRLIAEPEVPAQEADDLVVQAVASLSPIEALEGKPGVSVKAVAESLKKSVKTVRRSLDRLIDADRIVVTGTMSKQAKLYAVNSE